MLKPDIDYIMQNLEPEEPVVITEVNDSVELDGLLLIKKSIQRMLDTINRIIK